MPFFIVLCRDPIKQYPSKREAETDGYVTISKRTKTLSSCSALSLNHPPEMIDVFFSRTQIIAADNQYVIFRHQIRSTLDFGG